MNIIQQQELARNSSEQQLISLAEQPNPSIMPPYLVTGELMRRKSIREKMAQAPQQTVSEEVLEEAVQSNMPQGIGALTEDMATPMAAPQEEIMSESETISETGIANLPAPNIGQNYAGGGIVGYDKGGPVIYEDGTKGYFAGAIVNAGRAALPYIGKGLKSLKNTFMGTKGVPAKAGYNPLLAPGISSIGARPAIEGTKGLLRTHPYVSATTIGGIAYGLLPNGEKEEISNETLEEIVNTPKGPEKIIATETEEVVNPIETARERMMKYKELMGEDPNQARIQERLDKMDARATNQEDQALNMAMIRGGLGMAGGQSQNFLSNLTEGFGAGVDTYTGEIDKVRQAENDIFALDTQMANAQRVEQIAGATYGLESLEAEEARNAQIALQTQKDTLALKLAEINNAGAMDRAKLGLQTNPAELFTVYQEYLQTISTENPPTFEDFKKMVMGSSGASAPGAGYGKLMSVDESATKKKTVS